MVSVGIVIRFEVRFGVRFRVRVGVGVRFRFSVVFPLGLEFG